MQQTFKFDLNELPVTHIEDTTEEIKSTFIDETIDGFCETIVEEGNIPIGKSFSQFENFIIITIEYTQLTEDQKKQIARQRAASSGLTIPDLQLK
jgi:hypothetical protein